MDLGISGRRAMVCAASKGLGKACAVHLAREGADVTIVSRDRGRLEAAAEEISGLAGADVSLVVGDLGEPDGRAAALEACPDPDILVTNNGGPPPGNFRDWTRDDWVRALDMNMLSAIELIKATIDPMIERKWGRIVNITSAAVKSPYDVLGLSNGARAGLTGFVAGLSREVAKHNVIINNLLPGPFLTDRLKGTFEARAKGGDRPSDEIMAEAARSTVAGRFGDPDEFGAVCAFLCSDWVGYLVGQNVLLDGGAFRATM